MKHIVDYLESGRPVIGLRTATHSFAYPGNSHSKYKKYQLGQSRRGVRRGLRSASPRRNLDHSSCAQRSDEHPRRYRARRRRQPHSARHRRSRNLGQHWRLWHPPAAVAELQPLLFGEVIEGGKPSGKPVAGKLNNPMMPIAWTRSYSLRRGKTGRVFTTTMGSAADLQNAAFRRLLVNACYWAIGMAEKIPTKAQVDLVPGPDFHSGIKPAELQCQP